MSWTTFDPVGAGLDGHEVRLVEVGRARPFALRGIATPEGLPGEIIVFEIEASRQALGALLQNVSHRPGAAARQGVVLHRRNAESEQRGAVRRDPAQHGMIECGRDLAREDLALLFDRAGVEHPLRIGAEHAGREMPGGDEASEQAEVIEIARKPRDPAPARQIAAFPIIAAVLIEVRGDEIVIEMDVATIIGGAEKAIERRVIGQMLSGGELQLQERDVRRVEIDRVDARRVCRRDSS